MTAVPDGPEPDVGAAGGCASEAVGSGTRAAALDTSWRRTSYSALTAGVHDATPVIASEPEVAEKDDEPTTPVPRPALRCELRDVASPMAELPGGASFGTLVHAVLERVDTTATDLAAAVREHAFGQQARLGPADLDPLALTDALLPPLRTPLGALADGRALADIAPGDRLAELDFELPLRGGDHPNGTSSLGELSAAAARAPAARTIRCARTPTCSTTRCSATRRCAAISTAASTPCCASTAGSSSSTTRPTGSAIRTSR